MKIVLEREEDGRVSAVVPELPGCASWGETYREALAHIMEAAETYLDTQDLLRARDGSDGDAIPLANVARALGLEQE